MFDRDSRLPTQAPTLVVRMHLAVGGRPRRCAGFEMSRPGWGADLRRNLIDCHLGPRQNTTGLVHRGRQLSATAARQAQQDGSRGLVYDYDRMWRVRGLRGKTEGLVRQ